MNSIFDFELTVEERLRSLEEYSNPLEVVQRIGGMYSFSGAKMYQEYLEKIITSSSLSSVYKADAAKSLFDFEEFQEEIKDDDDDMMKEIKQESNDSIVIRNATRLKKAYECLSYLCDHFDESISTPYKVDLIKRLMVNKDFDEISLSCLKRIVSDLALDTLYRYKLILSIEKMEVHSKEMYLIELLSYFIKKEKTVRFIILAIQNLLQNYIIDVKSRIQHELTLLDIGKDCDVEYNTRADACDALLNLGTLESLKKEAEDVLLVLGGRSAKTVYENAQNVHNTKLEESSLIVIRFLMGIQSKGDLEEVITSIEKEIGDEDDDKKKKIQLSLNRITIDRSFYHNTSLSTILIKVWSYIERREEEDIRIEMRKRLLEELYDMSGTCSSGFILRLLNVLSGFEEEATLKMSFEDQIVGNFVGRLNGYAKKICDKSSPFYKEKLKDVLKLLGKKEEQQEEAVLEFSENVLLELCEETSDWANRRNFLLFFRTYLPILREELIEEFKDHVTETEMDLYLRKAISTYEGVNFVA